MNKKELSERDICTKFLVRGDDTRRLLDALLHEALTAPSAVAT